MGVSPAFARRALLVGGGGVAGVLLTRGFSAPPAPYPELLRAFAATLTPYQRKLLVFPADHPSRQIDNTIAVLDGPHLGTLLSPAQEALVKQLYASMLSPRGRSALARTLAIEGRLEGCMMGIYGDPEQGNAQTVISGGHHLARGGGESREGAAFGGGLAYGHQGGNGRWRVKGNSFRYHGDAANELYAALSPAERAGAMVPDPPHELVLQPQDSRGRFSGLRLGGASDAAKAAGARLLDTVLGLYPADAQNRAMSCLRGNGGVEGLHIAYHRGFYEDMTPWSARDGRGDPYWQVWRLEGPGTVIHFQGHPHVHAYVQIVREPRRANVGEALATTDVAVEGPAMRAFVEAALRRATGEALAFSAPEPPARFCPGEVTTGLAYALDAYRERIAIATIDARAMAAPLRERLGAPAGICRVATTPYLASDRKLFGQPDSVSQTPIPLRDAFVAELRAGQLRSVRARPG